MAEIHQQFTNLEKVFWPEEGYTKGDLISYYDSISEYIYPYLFHKPQSLHRFPNGITGGRFYQKNVGEMPPPWVKTKKFFSESKNEYTHYITPDNRETILYMANLACIEMNPWNSKIESPKKPDYLVVDLDPEEIEFKEVIKTALAFKRVADEFKIPAYCKTSGATGLHIYVPTAAKYSYDQVKDFAHFLVGIVNEMLPLTTSLLRLPEKRTGRVYLDFLQNNLGQTMAAPYSVRPRQGAPVSTPVYWEEVGPGLKPDKFTIKNILPRLRKEGDIFKPVLGPGIDIGKILKRIEKS